MTRPQPKIPGTTPFDGEQARKGYALNKMCFSFNSAENRTAFKQGEEAYMRQYGLNEQQAHAIRARISVAQAPTGVAERQAPVATALQILFICMNRVRACVRVFLPYRGRRELNQTK